MQQRQNGRQLILIGVGVIVVVLVAGFLLTNHGGQSSNASASGALPVVVAVQDIPQGTVFKAGDPISQYFTVKQAPKTLVPFGAYQAVKQITDLTLTPGCGPVRAAGCQGQITTTQTIYQNSPVVSGMFTQLGQYRQGVSPSFALPYGYVGIAVNFDPVNSVYGSVFPGDDVDLIASYHGQKVAGLKAPPQTQFVLNDLRVISVNGPPVVPGGTTSPSTSNSSSNSSSSPGSTSNNQANGGSLILLVRFQQALEIQHLKDFGWQLSVVLRSPKETDIPHFQTQPVTDRWFFVKGTNTLKTDPGY
ncbi:MAG TPA: RcpC/CpaB family pilus assembly protein [Chloroflexota bacterium]|nr:RcpC/CpaB family pilus assembly protein [Chloroflexota bacterium]